MSTALRHIILVALLGYSLLASSQDQPVYNDYIHTQGLLNPAYAGTRETMAVLGIFRKQWFGFEGAPFHAAVNVHSPLSKFGKAKNLKKMGAGLTLSNDHSGLTNVFDFMAAASYQFDVRKDMKVSAGLQLGFMNMILKGNEAITVDYGDPMFNGRLSKFGFNFGVGGQLYTNKSTDNFFVGLSIPKFFHTKYDTKKEEIRNKVSMRDLHIYTYGGYIFQVGQEVLLKPTALMRIVPGSPMTFDVSLWVMLKDRVWLGASYRTVSEAVFAVEFQVTKTFTVEYSFDYSISDIRQYAKGGSHELSVKYDLSVGSKKSAPKTRGKSVRYF